MTIKIYWKVAKKSTGRYRSFSSRSWPHAYYDNAGNKVAAQILCSMSYSLPIAKSGDHPVLTLYVADHSVKTDEGTPTFSWLKIKRTFATLDQIKEALPGNLRFVDIPLHEQKVDDRNTG